MCVCVCVCVCVDVCVGVDGWVWVWMCGRVGGCVGGWVYGCGCICVQSKSILYVCNYFTSIDPLVLFKIKALYHFSFDVEKSKLQKV